jgi:hypothetical protein
MEMTVNHGAILQAAIQAAAPVEAEEEEAMEMTMNHGAIVSAKLTYAQVLAIPAPVVEADAEEFTMVHARHERTRPY